MAERLAAQASGSGQRLTHTPAHLEVVQQFGVRMHSFERNGQMQVCYDGELYRRVLAFANASAEQRARAALGLTRPDCIDPSLGPVLRSLLDDERRALLAGIQERQLAAMTQSRLHARRASVWASIAFQQARRGESSARAAQRALAELLAVRAEDLGEDHRAEYLEAVVRVGAIRWALAGSVPDAGPLALSASPGEPGQTCVALQEGRDRLATPLIRRCTYGIARMASAQAIAQGRAVVLAVQPLESWRELWVFHASRGSWRIDVLSPGAGDPEDGYVEYAGFVPRTRRLLVVREVKEQGHIRRHFEELRLDDLVLVKQTTSELLPDFGRWQDVNWRRDTLALH